MAAGPGPAQPQPDISLRIAPVQVELAPNRFISTIGYNGTAPGPILRVKAGKPVNVELTNDTDTPEQVHWHGLYIPDEFDGSEEEGTPAVPPHGSRRYQMTPTPAGTRWYHSHAMAGADLHKGTYTGQFGFLIVEGNPDPGNYDQELFLALRDWEPFFMTGGMDTDADDLAGPQPERPAVLDTRPPGLEVTSQLYSINDKMLGAGEPVRVKPGQRVLLHLLNASAIENRRIALPGHSFQIIALDGNPVPNPASTETIQIGPGERVDCVVTMNQPGVWILGELQDDVRNNGLGIAFEYANQNQQPQWAAPRDHSFDYCRFAKPGATPPPAPAQSLEMIFQRVPQGDGVFDAWWVNGKPYPHEGEFTLHEGTRYRLVFRNRSDDAHPVHLHRHSFELVDCNGTPTAGVIKDTVIVPYYGRTTVDFTADQPGLSLVHCHIQLHMDYGFKALLRTA